MPELAISACRIVSTIEYSRSGRGHLTSGFHRTSRSSLGAEVHLGVRRRPDEGHHVSLISYLLCAIVGPRVHSLTALPPFSSSDP